MSAATEAIEQAWDVAVEWILVIAGVGLALAVLNVILNVGFDLLREFVGGGGGRHARGLPPMYGPGDKRPWD